MFDPVELKALALRRAAEEGFVRAGVAPAPVAGAERLAAFLASGRHADMAWLARSPAERFDATNLLPAAASIICLAASYAPGGPDDGGGHVARYARGRDYHRLLKRRCRRIVESIVSAAPGTRTRICVDTAPASERSFAAAAGLGWIGRNGCLIVPGAGSYVVLAEVVTDLPLPPDGPMELGGTDKPLFGLSVRNTPRTSKRRLSVPPHFAGGCGDCRACVDACPGGAIAGDGLVDCRRCVSYLTIEHRGPIDGPLRAVLGDRLFGCDRCQEACPHNRGVRAGDAELLGPSELAKATPADVLEWTAEDWDRLTRGSAGRRASHAMYLRNAAMALGNRAPG